MNQINAIKAASKLGTVAHKGNQFWVTTNGQRLSWFEQEGSAMMFHTQRVSEHVDSRTDYFPGGYHSNITQAIKWVTRAA